MRMTGSPGTSVRYFYHPLVNAGGKDVYRIGTARHCPNSPTNSDL